MGCFTYAHAHAHTRGNTKTGGRYCVENTHTDRYIHTRLRCVEFVTTGESGSHRQIFESVLLSAVGGLECRSEIESVIQ
eukprot:m.36885 g.36885  ORF g.36885 m.36885 type:complete len:79 (+) comp12911_c0_seq1:59-295(+)